MGRRTSTPQGAPERDQPVDPGAGPGPCPTPTPQGQPPLTLGAVLVRTLRHFFPRFNDWLDDLPEPRRPERIVYDKRFLVWWGLALFLFKLKSRRALDFQLSPDSQALPNLNLLAGTRQGTRPVHDTLDYFLTRLGPAPLAGVRRQQVYQLIRAKTLDPARLLGHLVMPVDGTGYLVFHHAHCCYCLTQNHGDTTIYQHQALEAKLLGPAGLVVSVGTEFIDNRDAADTPPTASVEQRKQDCELKALRRLAAQIRHNYPQLKLCLSGDGLYACGAGFAIARDYRLAYVYTFQPGRLPAVWRDVQGVLQLCPENRVEVTTATGTQQVYRWVNGHPYRDSEGRDWKVNVITCVEETPAGTRSEWSWVTNLPVTRQTVAAIATHGGRQRWRIENEGFNTQKNSDLNLGHAYSHKAWEAFYLLLQIAHTLVQLVEKGSLLRQLARQEGKCSAVALYGSLALLTERLRESLRNQRWPEATGRPERIALDSS